jgi:DNA-binding NarL/FixJ family response regulator
MNKIKTIIADDHTMFLQGIDSMLKNEDSIEIVGKATNGQEVLAILENKMTNVVVLDISMPKMDGIELTKALKQKYPEIKVLILSTHSNSQMIAKLIRIGANGYLLKNAEKNELLEAIHTVSGGNQYFSKEVKEIYNEFSLKLNQNSITTTQLSSREEEVIKLISQGLTTQEIGDKLFISLNTVNTHRINLLSKLNVKNTAGLVKYAIENGFLD